MKYFKGTDRETTVSQEIIASFSTFLAMVYIIFVNPAILHVAGMPLEDVFLTTCVVSAIGSILTGFLSNLPIAVAPGLALNTYFTYVIVIANGYRWQDALGMVFISGLIFLLITLTKVRQLLITAIPKNLMLGVGVGLGLFIALIGLKNANLIEASPHTFIHLGHVKSLPALLFVLGFCLILVFDYYRIKGAILFSILGVTLSSILLKITPFYGFFAEPSFPHATWLAFDLQPLWHVKALGMIFSFLIITLFDGIGTLIGLITQSDFLTKKTSNKQISNALLADSIATVTGSVLGTSSTSPFLESAAGINSGGRTGLTSIFVGIWFLLMIWMSPFAKTIPLFAAAPALLLIGIKALSAFYHINRKDKSELIPALLTILMIPYTFSIAEGLGAGLILYVVMKIFSGQYRSINAMMWILAVLFTIFFCVLPI